MASPNTVARKNRLASLVPSNIVLARELPARRTAPGEYAELLALSARRRNQRNARERVNANGVRAIPTSGPGRRRAKRHRQQGLCVALASVGVLCPQEAVAGARCGDHLEREPIAHGAE